MAAAGSRGADLTRPFRLRNAEPGYFVVIEEDGKEIATSRRPVDEGLDPERDEKIVAELRKGMGPTCDVVFRPEKGFR